ncbi:MAG: rod shape-determining protein RodA [Desulfobacterales bacterium]|nr:rod shape-determining protein RodA [Desulfobacterales bacterium]
MFDRRLIQNFDWVLLILLLMIAAMSVFNLYSATHPIREMGGAHVFVKQIYWFLIGFGVFFVMATFNYSILERFAYPLFFVSVALLLLVLFSGKISSGSQRWLSLGPISFQPSELTKIAVVLALAKFYSEEDSHRVLTLRDSWLPFMLIGVPSALILKEPDLGTALLIIVASFSLLLFVRVNWKSLMILAAAGISMSPIIWFRLAEYQQNRILTFIRPDMDPLGTGYHINQSKIAIGSGLFWGKGYLQGTQTRLLFLPEQHTDFAFSVLAEEWGFIFSVFLLLLYLFLILCGLNIAKNSKDKFGSLIAIGFVAIIFWHVVINVGMVTGLLPVVGIPLVLFSYGGSSLVATMAGMGLLMNISMRRFMFSA